MKRTQCDRCVGPIYLTLFNVGTRTHSRPLLQLSIVHHSIEKTGMYIVLFGVCSPFTAPVLVSGSIDSMDPCKFLDVDCAELFLYNEFPLRSLTRWVPARRFVRRYAFLLDAQPCLHRSWGWLAFSLLQAHVRLTLQFACHLNHSNPNDPLSAM